MLDFLEIALLINLAALAGIIANRLKQPPLLGFIVAGFIISAFKITGEHLSGNLELFSQIGITFLLFALGLELNITDIKKLGKVAFITGMSQIAFTTVFGFLISILLGFSTVASLYISIGLTFSSTIVIVKLLSSKNELNTLHGKISVGFLLVQDLAAMLILIAIVALQGKSNPDSTLGLNLLYLLIKIPVLGIIIYVFSHYFLPWIIRQTMHEREVLFITIIAWALFLSALVYSPIFGFSIEMGALLAGVALSSRKESMQIESWTKPLRDFFLTVFFVLLGTHLEVDSIGQAIVPSIIFSLFVLIGNPLIVMIIIGYLGYNKRTGFLISLTVAQISEFSLLLASMGYELGHLSKNDLAIVTIVGGITMSVSSYFIYYNHEIYERLKGYLNIFERESVQKRGPYNKEMKNHIVILGFHRLSDDIYALVQKNKNKFLVVDHNPMTIQKLALEGINVIYGDINDSDIYEHMHLDNAKMVISTIPNNEVNLKLMDYLKSHKLEMAVIVTCGSNKDAFNFYEAGADYVIYPHLLAGKRLKSIVESEENYNAKIAKFVHEEKKILYERLGLNIKAI